MAEKNTKRVAGEDLTIEAFAYRGDPKKKSQWKLPIKFKSEAKTKRHIRNALSRYSGTDMPNKAEKEKAWGRIVAAAKKYGIEVSDEKDGKKSSEVEAQRQLDVRMLRLARGQAANPESDDPALAWDDEEGAEARGEREDFEELPMLVREFEITGMVPVYARDADPLQPDQTGITPPADKTKDEPRGDAEELENEGQDGQAQGKNGKKKKRDTDTFDIEISSEARVQRWFGTEILDHSEGAVDLSRAKLGLSFLDSHDAIAIRGIVENIRVADKKLRGRLRFSRNAEAQNLKQDMRDKIRKFISVGYAVSDYVLEEHSKEKGDTYRAAKWTPMEVSSVGIPADISVGVRSETGRLYPVTVTRSAEVSSTTPASQPNSTGPADSGNGGPAQRDSQRSTTVEPNAEKDARAAAAEIFRLGQQHGIANERLVKMVEDGITVNQASRQILDEVAKRAGAAAPVATPAAEAQENLERLELTESEQGEYNVARAIMTAVENVEAAASGSNRRKTCFELEVSDQIERTWKGPRHGGVYIPWSMRHAWNAELEKKYGAALKNRQRQFREQLQMRAGLYTGGSTVGQSLVFTEPGEFIQYLYNRMRVKELGARTIAGLRDNVSFPKQTGRATGSWVGENPGTDVGDSNLTLGSIPSGPHTYQSSSSYSRQLLAQAVIDVNTLVREDLARDLALAVDSVAIVGGSTNQPKGIMLTTNVQTYTLENDTGNGAPPDWNDVVIMSQKLEEANADQLGDFAWLTTPGIKSRLKRTARLGNVVGLPIWADDDTVNGYEARSTNQVPKTGAEGTLTNGSALILGAFQTMIIAMWGSGFELIVNPYRLKKQGMIELTTFMLNDVVLRYPVAFIFTPYAVS